MGAIVVQEFRGSGRGSDAGGVQEWRRSGAGVAWE